MSGICRLPLTSRFKGLKNVSDRNEKSCPICANRQDSHKWERLQTPSRIHSISHESRGQVPINHKHTETKECAFGTRTDFEPVSEHCQTQGSENHSGKGRRLVHHRRRKRKLGDYFGDEHLQRPQLAESLRSIRTKEIYNGYELQSAVRRFQHP